MMTYFFAPVGLNTLAIGSLSWSLRGRIKGAGVVASHARPRPLHYRSGGHGVSIEKCSDFSDVPGLRSGPEGRSSQPTRRASAFPAPLGPVGGPGPRTSPSVGPGGVDPLWAARG